MFQPKSLRWFARSGGTVGLVFGAFFGIALYAQLGDATSGKEMLAVRGCTTCHPVAGRGDGSAPDLGSVAAANVSTAELAATMWNHGPRMWTLMDESAAELPALSEYDVGNLYAYFYSLRYFDPPGDADRGKKVFGAKQCGHCHHMRNDPKAKPTAPPVTAWLMMANRTDWVQQMWNHGTGMAARLEAAKIEWPEFTLGEMVDLLTYLEELPDLQLADPGMRMGDWEAGERLFSDKQCAQCHTLGERAEGKIDLLELVQMEPRLSGLAVSMWNHRSKMEAAARERGIALRDFEAVEMEDLLAYIFKKGYFEQEGDAARGEALIANKGCGSCHGQADSEAAELTPFEDGYTAIRLTSAVWVHGPRMKDLMEYKKQEWPTLTAQNVADLVAYLDQD